MSKPILFISGFDSLEENTLGLLKDLFAVSFVSIDGHDQLKSALGGCDVFWFRLNHRLDQEVLRFARCKTIVCAVTGLDHIDLDACRSEGIDVLSLKGETAFLRQITATAEHAFGLMLALCRMTFLAGRDVLYGRWNRDKFQGLQLRGKRLGILGFGRLGRMMGHYGVSFGMKVSYYDVVHMDPPDRRFHKCNSTSELFEGSDFLSIHIPYTSENHHLIGRELLSKLPSTAMMVNTSRGGVVQEDKVAEAILSGFLSGYATDVIETEPDIAHSALIDLMKQGHNVLVTPHIGGFTHNSVAETEAFMARKLVEHYA